MLKLKVCGMRDEYNILALSGIKPDFIGFIFYKYSPRNVGWSEIPNTEGIKRCGVFVDENLNTILTRVKMYHLDAVQLHGSELPELCKKLKAEGLIVLKAFSVDANFDFSLLRNYSEHVDYFLFDAKGKFFGGNGVKFNWNLLHDYTLSTPFFLSGGINLMDMKTIQKIKHPAFAGIDINSGVEIMPGFKNIEQIIKIKNELSTRI